MSCGEFRSKFWETVPLVFLSQRIQILSYVTGAKIEGTKRNLDKIRSNLVPVFVSFEIPLAGLPLTCGSEI